MLPDKPFYMIRHGQTEANLSGIMAGRNDSPLTAEGRKQALDAQRVISKLKTKPTAIIHSNLSRARDTATIINGAFDVSMHEESDLAEIFVGDWEGEPVDTCLSTFLTREDPPNGERFDEFETRVQRGINKSLRTFESPILIVSHGGVFFAFGGVYKLKALDVVKNAHLYEFKPNLENEAFPWDLYSYDLDSETKELVRTKEDLYDACKRF